jgi:hypothetical protein
LSNFIGFDLNPCPLNFSAYQTSVRGIAPGPGKGIRHHGDDGAIARTNDRGNLLLVSSAVTSSEDNTGLRATAKMQSQSRIARFLRQSPRA